LGAIKAVTDSDFEGEVLKSDTPVVVDFWAEWCGPCRLVAPILEEIAEENAEKIKIVKLNVDENPDVPRQYGIMQIPTMNVYSDGEVVQQIIGAKPKAAMLRELSAYL
jgi:thioredoxin 1